MQRTKLDYRSDKTVNAAVIELSAEAIIDALHLPKDTEILACEVAPNLPGVVRMTVVHKDIRARQVGELLPVIAPMLRYIRPDVPDIVEFAGWGQ